MRFVESDVFWRRGIFLMFWLKVLRQLLHEFDSYYKTKMICVENWRFWCIYCMNFILTIKSKWFALRIDGFDAVIVWIFIQIHTRKLGWYALRIDGFDAIVVWVFILIHTRKLGWYALGITVLMQLLYEF